MNGDATPDTTSAALDPSTTGPALDLAALIDPPPAAERAQETARENLARIDAEDLAAGAPTSAPTSSAAGELYARERLQGWDPTRHVTPPTRTARRTWKLLPRGATPPPAGLVTPDGAAVEDPAAVAARDGCDLVFTLAPALLGAHWTPEPEERERVEAALVRFYRRYPDYCMDLPPGWALAAAVGAYAAPRMMTIPLVAGLVGKLTGGAFGARTDDGAALDAHELAALRNAAESERVEAAHVERVEAPAQAPTPATSPAAAGGLAGGALRHAA